MFDAASTLRPLLLVIAVALVAACAEVVAEPSASPPATGPSPSGSGLPTLEPTTPPEPTPAPPGADLATIVDGLRSPVDVTTADDGTGRIFVVEQAGTIRIVAEGVLASTPFLDISGRLSSGGERGLLGLAFHPEYPTDPRLFVDYTDRAGDTVISSFRVDPGDPDRALPDSERMILRIEQPFTNHNGGAVVFGPDGMLYIGMGDGGSGGDPQGNGQRLDTLLAKILRIDVRGPASSGAAYVVPSDNPYVTIADARPEIWLTGLRNPWRIRFDDATGDLWIGDVGQGAWEEIDVIRAGTSGQDLGWNVMEGSHCYDSADCDRTGLTLPVAEYGHGFGCAVVGGVVATSVAVPAIEGRYVYADACLGNVWSLDPVGDELREAQLIMETGRSISSIALATDGTVLMTDLGSGELLRVVAAP